MAVTVKTKTTPVTWFVLFCLLVIPFSVLYVSFCGKSKPNTTNSNISSNK